MLGSRIPDEFLTGTVPASHAPALITFVFATDTIVRAPVPQTCVFASTSALVANSDIPDTVSDALAGGVPTPSVTHAPPLYTVTHTPVTKAMSPLLGEVYTASLAPVDANVGVFSAIGTCFSVASGI